MIFHPSMVFDDFWIYVWTAEAFPSAQVYHGVEMVVDKWEQALSTEEQTEQDALYFTTGSKSMPGQELGNPLVNLHLGNSVYCTLASAGANLRQIQNKVDEHPFEFL